MDQLTHSVRRSNWINIIQQCQDRPAGITAKQWLAENGISERSYYIIRILSKKERYFSSVADAPIASKDFCGYGTYKMF